MKTSLSGLKSFIGGGTLTWFCSGLSNRNQHVSVNGYNSSNPNVTSGVP